MSINPSLRIAYVSLTYRTNMSCCEKSGILLKELERWTIQSKKLKQEYQSLLVKNLEKDLVIDDLEQAKMTKKYTSIEHTVSADTLERMKLLSDDKKDDSPFVYLFLCDIYGSALKDKTLSGNNYRKVGHKSNEISRVILDKLRAIFEERLTNVPMAEQRASSMKKCIRNAIDKAKRGEQIYFYKISRQIHYLHFYFTAHNAF